MTRCKNSEITSLTLNYCFTEIQRFYPELTKALFAKFINGTKQNIGQRLQKESKLTTTELNVLREKLEQNNIPTRFLDFATLPLEKSIVQIPIRDDVSLSCGTGTAPNAEYITDMLAFDSNYLRKLGGNANNVSVVYARGDSMADKIESGDALIVDDSKTQIVDGFIYAFLYNDELYCKQLQKLPNGIRAISLNKEYEPFMIDDTNCFKVIGRIIGSIKGFN